MLIDKLQDMEAGCLILRKFVRLAIEKVSKDWLLGAMDQLLEDVMNGRLRKARILTFEPITNVGRIETVLHHLSVFRSDPAVENGVSITSYGRGQLIGVMYTVPAHGQIDVALNIKLQCVTPSDVIALNNMIKGMLDASHSHKFEETESTNVSGGLGFFAFWSGGVSASYSDVKHTLDGWGLSAEDQRKIVNGMMEIAQNESTFNYKGTIYNRDFDYDVTGSLFAIVMDATIQQGQYHKQLRFLAPKVHLNTNDGDSLPVVGTLYS
ncbi:hypothetical protein ACCS70_33010 [Rhizobium ruizarguesonis]|uniref:hypothetical protein n=1 Tax=Rhizobium ruizarguesonis TaxID=2081791 RepID=UPI0013B9E043|nr:hypothetical protein [Rhizobium ruizarguesonis]NEH32722.1 hypothetical protein [Rhizobium ruizarguesonis]NEJ10780.1 hypothetical protein [Rhizobium ruizarguesonis]NEJ91352.1 hypothetical protein [Rhizobium ruizarguesonis]NEK13101.1 hypothetical protein [Rhizobium ruizarguesonis]